MSSPVEPASILVVDDLPEKLLVYETILSALGENLVLVSSGSQALKKLLNQSFAVILLDVNMPDMDGFETARLIRGHRRSSSTPIIFLTAFADEVRTAEGYASGAVDYLPTPVVPEILRAKVRVFVELYKMRQQVAQRAEERAHHFAAEDANRRLTFLSDAGAILGRSLEFRATARDLVQLPVPFLADACLLSFASPLIPYNPALFARHGSQREVIVGERPEDLPTVLKDVAQLALETGRRVPPGRAGSSAESVMAIPLEARGRMFAVLALSRHAGRPPFAGQDISLATALASRAAPALDNALLHEELVKADRQKVDFLSMLAHELRNPLAPISNAVQLLRLQAADDPDLQWSADVIDRQTRQLVRLVDDLLDVSRITSGKIRLKTAPMDFCEAVRIAVEASQPLIDERNHQLSVTMPARSIWIEGDQTRITQVVTNLLNNAAKYTEDGGQIQLSLRCDDAQATLSVRDTGIGIPADMLQTVFDLFTQAERTLDRSSGGLGIGLTLVRRLVEKHGGAVTVESEGQGRGSMFTVRLPTCRHEEVVNSETPGDLPGEIEPVVEKVLIVDDNADAADSLATLFRLAGYQVQVAYDGLSGVTMATAFEPGVVLLDIGLPGLDGYAVARRLRDQDATRNSLLIAVSGYGQARDEARSAQAGFDRHLVKPVEFTRLQAALQADRRAVAAEFGR